MWAIHTANLLQRGITQVMQNVVLAKQVGPTMQRRGGHNGPASMWSSNITPPGHNGEDPNEDEIIRVLKYGSTLGYVVGTIYAIQQLLETFGVGIQPDSVQPTPTPTPTPTPMPAPATPTPATPTPMPV